MTLPSQNKPEKLSFMWNLVLKALSEYPDGVNEDVFIAEIAAQNRHGTAKSVLNQMWFSDHNYYNTLSGGMIQISNEGKRALEFTANAKT